MVSKNFKKELRDAKIEALELQSTLIDIVKLHEKLFIDSDKIKAYIVNKDLQTQAQKESFNRSISNF